MQLTKLIGSEITTPTSAGAATSLVSATCVRLCNNTTNDVLVSITTAVGAANTISFTMLKQTVEFLQKAPTDVIFTDSAIKASKVGFTN